jgi:hypothetical protein
MTILPRSTTSGVPAKHSKSRRQSRQRDAHFNAWELDSHQPHHAAQSQDHWENYRQHPYRRAPSCAPHIPPPTIASADPVQRKRRQGKGNPCGCRQARGLGSLRPPNQSRLSGQTHWWLTLALFSGPIIKVKVSESHLVLVYRLLNPLSFVALWSLWAQGN